LILQKAIPQIFYSFEIIKSKIEKSIADIAYA